MFIEGRWKGAVLMCLLWAAGAAAVLYFKPFETTDWFSWSILAFSLIFLIMGLTTYLKVNWVARMQLNSMSEQERSRFDMKRFTSMCGMSYALISFLYFLGAALDNELKSLTILIASLVAFYPIVMTRRMQGYKGLFGTKRLHDM